MATDFDDPRLPVEQPLHHLGQTDEALGAENEVHRGSAARKWRRPPAGPHSPRPRSGTGGGAPAAVSCSTREKTFSCAFSRTEQVFRITIPAGPAPPSGAAAAGRQPSLPSAAAIFSES